VYKEYEGHKLRHCVKLVLRVPANILITFNTTGYGNNDLMNTASHNTLMSHNINTYVTSVKITHMEDAFFEILG